MSNIECPTCRERAVEIERLREQNRLLLNQLMKVEQVQIPKYILTTQEELDKIKKKIEGETEIPEDIWRKKMQDAVTRIEIPWLSELEKEGK